MAVKPTDYETVAAGQSDQILGPVGAKGDILERLVVTVNTPATSTVSITDGNGAAIAVMPATVAVGVYVLAIGARAKNATTPGWKVTTGAGVTVLAVGRFT